MGGLSAIHWIVVGLVVVLLFGTRKLPELGSGLGQAIANFRKAYKENNTIDVSPEKKEGEQEKK